MPAIQSSSDRVRLDSFNGSSAALENQMVDSDWLVRTGPLVLVIYAVLLFPPEIQITLSGLKITGYRVAILGCLPFALLRFFGGWTRVSLGDFAILFCSAWTLLGFAYIYDPIEGLLRGTAVIIDALGAYLVARTSIASHNDIRRILILIAPGVAASGFILMLESVTRTLIFRPALASIFGPVSVYSGGEASGALTYMNNERLGLLRAYSGFSHPILAGTTLASLLPLYALSGLRSWPFALGLTAAVLAVFSMSSITFIVILLVVGIIVVDRAKDLFKFVSWPTITAVVAIVVAVAHLMTENGIFRYIIRYTFNPHNGAVRLLQWESGIEAMNRNPWFGVGYEPIEVARWLSPSLDAHFLAIGVRSGWLVASMLMAGCLAIMVALGMSMGRHSRRERDLILGLNIAIAVLTIASMTVAFYAETNIYFMAVLGLGAAAAALPTPARWPDFVLRDLSRVDRRIGNPMVTSR